MCEQIRYITSLNKLYADDTIILSVMSSECLGKIQADLDNAYDQTQEWLLILTQKSVQLYALWSNNKKYPL